MHLVTKNLFQFDVVNFGTSWLLNVDTHPQLVIRSKRTLLKQIMWLKPPSETLKGPTKVTRIAMGLLLNLFWFILVFNFNESTFLGR